MKRKIIWWWILGLVVVFLAMVVYAIIPSTPWCLALERKDAVTALIALAGVVGVVFTIRQTQKRITLQEKQYNAQTAQFAEQAKQFAEQTELQMKQQRDARFASGVELLGNPHESTRIGGAYNLYFLARDFEELRPAVCEILCAHLRTIAHKSKFETDDERAKYPKNEVQSIIDLLFRKHEKDDSGEEVSIFLNQPKNLREICLSGISISKREGSYILIIKHVNFSKAIMIGVSFIEAEFCQVRFVGSSLTDVRFDYASLTGFMFFNANLTGVNFSFATFIGGVASFKGTKLADYSYEEITRSGRSLELTRPKEAESSE
jgi:hypothetical protein